MYNACLVPRLAGRRAVQDGEDGIPIGHHRHRTTPIRRGGIREHGPGDVGIAIATPRRGRIANGGARRARRFVPSSVLAVRAHEGYCEFAIGDRDDTRSQERRP